MEGVKLAKDQTVFSLPRKRDRDQENDEAEEEPLKKKEKGHA